MTEGPSLSLAEHAILAMLSERPAHGFAIARLTAPGGELGQIWHVPRPVGFHHLIDRDYSNHLAKDVTRGKKSAAMAGRPAGAPQYGYRRVYDTSVMIKGRPKIAGDEPNVFDGDRHAITDSPAYIVREIFDRIERGESISSIRRRLEERQILTPRKPRKHTDYPYRWGASAIRSIATNPAHIGKRVYQTESGRAKDRQAAILDGIEVMWDPLVSEEQSWAVQRILSAATTTDRSGKTVPRLRWRPAADGKRNHLLTSVARCAVCHDVLVSGGHKTKTGKVTMYRCIRGACTAIRADWLDEYVEDRVVSWLGTPAVYEALWAARDDDSATAVAARADVERLNLQIEQWQQIGEQGESDPVTVARSVAGLRRKLAEAEELARPASLNPLLGRAIGPDAADKWVGFDLSTRRQIIAMVASIEVRKGSRGGHWKLRAFDESRVVWRWLVGPEGERATEAC